jgi:ATP-dependent DNA helicase RecG
MDLTTSLQSIKGVGEKTYEQFAAAGLLTVEDLISFLPRAYEDFSHVTSIADVAPGKLTIEAR